MANRNSAISFHERSSKKRVVLFKLIGILIAFLILVLLEVGLRIFNYGYDLSLFKEDPKDKNFLVLNPDAPKRYFNDPALAPSGNSEPFKKVKDKNICRIFILGESTTIGYPYFHNGSFHRWLQYRLMQTFPDRRFEIINLSLTAVNSYTVLEFAKELINYQPDAVLIYSGQNEYYGTLGVASSNKISGNPNVIRAVLYLRQLRLTQLITNLYIKISGSHRPTTADSAETLMQRMVGEQKIAYGSPLYNRGVKQFTSNMNAVLDLFNEHHIPVFLSNLVSNEKDLKPFISIEPDSMKFPDFKKKFDSGVIAFQHNELTASYDFLTDANRLYGEHALCNYYLGLVSYGLRDFKQSEVYFSKARDLDGLRFRAPSQFNEIIVRLCASHPNAYLVDTKASFAAHSDNKIIGNGLILEHVHPSLEGYAIMSDAFYEALKKGHILNTDNVNEMSFQQLKAQMPVTRLDSLIGIYRIDKLKKYWPFNEEISQDSSKMNSEEGKLADDVVTGNIMWQKAMKDLYDYYVSNNRLAEAGTVMEAMVLEHPYEEYFYQGAAMIYGKLNDFEKSVFYFKKAFTISPTFDDAKTLFVIYLKLDKPTDAIPYLDYAIHNNTSNLNLLPVKKLTGEIIQLQKKYAKDSTDISVLNLIASKYLTMDNKEGASKYVAKILRQEPANKEALILLGQLKKG
jgi:tetratricopeptide (TPR) repeat protein